MARLYPLALLLSLCACRPMLGPTYPREIDNGAQTAALADFDEAAARLRSALLGGAPEADDAAHFDALLDSAARLRSAAKDPASAERFLAARAAALLAEAAALLPDPAARDEAARRLLRGYRLWVLPRHPEAGRFLR